MDLAIALLLLACAARVDWFLVELRVIYLTIALSMGLSAAARNGLNVAAPMAAAVSIIVSNVRFALVSRGVGMCQSISKWSLYRGVEVIQCCCTEVSN